MLLIEEYNRYKFINYCQEIIMWQVKEIQKLLQRVQLKKMEVVVHIMGLGRLWIHEIIPIIVFIRVNSRIDLRTFLNFEFCPLTSKWQILDLQLSKCDKSSLHLNTSINISHDLHMTFIKGILVSINNTSYVSK